MKPQLILRESWQMILASKVPSLLIVLLATVMCAGTILTVGRTVATESQIEDRLESAGSRLLVVRDISSAGDYLTEQVVAATDGVSHVERAVGIYNAIDVVNGQVGGGGERVPAWGVLGDMENVAQLTSGRVPGPGEALVSREAMLSLGLEYPAGWVHHVTEPGLNDLNIVGSFEPKEPFADYGSGIIYAPLSPMPATSLQVILTNADVADEAQIIVLGIIDGKAEELRVESPIGVAALQAQIMEDVTIFGRTLLVGVLLAGAVLVAIVTLTDVLVRRADLGRRRALGATRDTIIGLVVLRTVIAACIGVILGISVSAALTNRLEAMPPTSFMVGVGILSIIAAIASSIPPAMYAAYRDPVAVLRTP
ncbi:FtsX-like permease family protein [Flaviflexus ciconiae]|uniref:FtsX-like permease family protein n=1 Tax=Flaviflexus ciconiae TaxID=2496867 RepID=A0A3S9PUI6_9ACTO|nr:FtsX-like permease family protein [Flaviflexus ciconiae]